VLWASLIVVLFYLFPFLSQFHVCGDTNIKRYRIRRIWQRGIKLSSSFSSPCFPFLPSLPFPSTSFHPFPSPSISPQTPPLIALWGLGALYAPSASYGGVRLPHVFWCIFNHQIPSSYVTEIKSGTVLTSHLVYTSSNYPSSGRSSTRAVGARSRSSPNLFWGWFPGRNQLCQISFQSVRGFWFYRESNFGFSHRNEVSPLTQGLNYRSAYDWNNLEKNHRKVEEELRY